MDAGAGTAGVERDGGGTQRATRLKRPGPWSQGARTSSVGK
jgi:hypothetical protein